MILLFSCPVHRDCQGALGPHFHSWDSSLSVKSALELTIPTRQSPSDVAFLHYPHRQLPQLRWIISFKTVVKARSDCVSVEAWELLCIEPDLVHGWISCISPVMLYSPRAMFIFHSSLCYFAQLWIFLWLPYIETIIQIESLPCKLPSVNRAPYPAGLLISDPVAIKPCLAEILTLTQRMRGRGFTHICVWCVLLSSLWEKGEQFLSWRENVDTPSPDPRVIFE